MRFLGFFSMMSLVLVTVIQPAWAVDSARPGYSGTLVLIFLGFCALIVVAQMVPAMILMMGTISGVAKRMTAKKKVAVARVDGEKEE